MRLRCPMRAADLARQVVQAKLRQEVEAYRAARQAGSVGNKVSILGLQWIYLSHSSKHVLACGP